MHVKESIKRYILSNWQVSQTYLHFRKSKLLLWRNQIVWTYLTWTLDIMPICRKDLKPQNKYKKNKYKKNNYKK